jgi:hypothetical protein
MLDQKEVQSLLHASRNVFLQLLHGLSWGRSKRKKPQPPPDTMDMRVDGKAGLSPREQHNDTGRLRTYARQG